MTTTPIRPALLKLLGETRNCWMPEFYGPSNALAKAIVDQVARELAGATYDEWRPDGWDEGIAP